jgi:hypothetical protein
MTSTKEHGVEEEEKEYAVSFLVVPDISRWCFYPQRSVQIRRYREGFLEIFVLR